jgi:hypothetical protein
VSIGDVIAELGAELHEQRYVGTMTMTWALGAVDGGTRVDITANDVPDGITADDHAAGMTSSLDKLASYVEG